MSNYGRIQQALGWLFYKKSHIKRKIIFQAYKSNMIFTLSHKSTVKSSIASEKRSRLIEKSNVGIISVYESNLTRSTTLY